jgi:hypothetical protein
MRPHNPADLPLVTFDNNVLIALRKEERAASAIRELLTLNSVGLITSYVTMSTAPEAQRPEEQMELQDQVAWMESLGISRETIFTSWRPVGFATPGQPGTMTFDSSMDVAFMECIDTLLFPQVLVSWPQYRDREVNALASRARKRRRS